MAGQGKNTAEGITQGATLNDSTHKEEVMNIGITTLTAISVQLRKHMMDYQSEIDKAYCAADDLTISLSAKLSPSEAGVRIVTSITFVESKVKDSEIIVVDEKQNKLFEGNLANSGD